MVIIASGNAEGKSVVLIRDSSLSRAPAETPPSSCLMMSFSLTLAASVFWGVCGSEVGLDRSEEDMDEAELATAAMSAVVDLHGNVNG